MKTYEEMTYEELRELPPKEFNEIPQSIIIIARMDYYKRVPREERSPRTYTPIVK